MSRPLRFLVIDDNQQDRFLVARELAKEFANSAVEQAADPAALALALASGRFDLVVTDFKLGWADGLQVLKAVKEHDPECPVLMFTDSGNEEVAVAAMHCGLDDYILKSVKHYHRLAMAARSALDKAAARRRAAAAEGERAELLRREQAAREEAEQLYAEAREEARRKDEFLAMLAHELRNPLAPLRAALHILRTRYGDEADLDSLATLMGRQTAHLTRLVDDLLDASRLAQGKIHLQARRLDAAVVLRGVLEDLLLGDRRDRVDARLSAQPLWVDADPVRLAQIVANLLGNADKYTPSEGRIALTADREGNDVVIRVRDDGIGVRPEMASRIFDLFTQGDRLPDRAAEGLGVGLTLVRRLVELHGGRVAVHSDGPGRGSEFSVRLPAQPPPPTPAPAPAAPESAGPLRILLCDDNVDGANTMALWLRIDKHDVRVVHNGPAALEAARAWTPEVVLLDIGLPANMDGFETGRRLRQDVGLTDVLLVAVTGYGRDEDRRRTQEAGFDMHLVKPVEPELLQEVLTRAKRRP